MDFVNFFAIILGNLSYEIKQIIYNYNKKPFVKKCKSEKTQRKGFRTNWRIVDQVNYRLSQIERNKELKKKKCNIFSCLCLRYRSIKSLRIYIP